MNTAVLPGGYALTTREGSMYDTAIKRMAVAGSLERQAELFATFRQDGTATGARRLLDQIGVPRAVLEPAVRASAAFLTHCEERTAQVLDRAGRGDAKAQRVTTKPEIWKDGCWIGDMDEVISILSGARTLEQLQRGKNQGILRRPKLMFDVAYRGEDQVLYLYPRRFHRVFVRARALAGE